MQAHFFDLTLPDPNSTMRFAERLGARLVCGDTLLLSGDIGAGKTHFARSLIQSLQDRPEDVPSPSFTLVQTYDTAKGEILHADLYRLNGPDGVDELGLWEAFGTIICLVEWPDRMGANAPGEALTLAFANGATAEARVVSASGPETLWKQRLEGICDA